MSEIRFGAMRVDVGMLSDADYEYVLGIFKDALKLEGYDPEEYTTDEWVLEFKFEKREV